MLTSTLSCDADECMNIGRSYSACVGLVETGGRPYVFIEMFTPARVEIMVGCRLCHHWE